MQAEQRDRERRERAQQQATVRAQDGDRGEGGRNRPDRRSDRAEQSREGPGPSVQSQQAAPQPQAGHSSRVSPRATIRTPAVRSASRDRAGSTEAGGARLAGPRRPPEQRETDGVPSVTFLPSVACRILRHAA